MIQDPEQPLRHPNERALQTWVADNPQSFGFDKFSAVFGEVRLKNISGRLDLLAIDPTGRVAIIECKQAINTEQYRTFIGQLIGYAAGLRSSQRHNLQNAIIGSDKTLWRNVNDVEKFIRGETFGKAIENIAAAKVTLVAALTEADQRIGDVIEYLNDLQPEVGAHLLTHNPRDGATTDWKSALQQRSDRGRQIGEKWNLDDFLQGISKNKMLGDNGVKAFVNFFDRVNDLGVILTGNNADKNGPSIKGQIMHFAGGNSNPFGFTAKKDGVEIRIWSVPKSPITARNAYLNRLAHLPKVAELQTKLETTTDQKAKCAKWTTHTATELLVLDDIANAIELLISTE